MPDFQFKHFFVNHSASSMKVGTDAVLLGAVADVSGCKRILEVGTGCGVVALAAAQKSKAAIYAIDIHEPSVKEATENFTSSKWADRLHAQNISFQQLAENNGERYDAIISNPPYFNHSLASPKASRQLARHTDKLSYRDFADASGKLLADNGRVWVILPAEESILFSTEMIKKGMRSFYELSISPKPAIQPNRKVLGFNRIGVNNSVFSKESLTIRTVEGGFTKAYKDLTRDYYLHFG